MGLFDFPRIHFKGNVDINVPTINNAYYFPLTIYDSMRSVPFLPPRLYFETAEQIKEVNAPIVPEIHNDSFNGYVYIEIATVSDIPTLRTWLQKPIKTDDPGDLLNTDYIPFYQKAELVWQESEGTTIIDNAMGYWNMWGDMGVSMKDVKVTGVQTFENDQVTSYTSDSPGIPADIQPILNAAFDFDTTPGSGRTTASMVETLSSQSIYANIFCSNVNLYNPNNPDETFLQGTPYRFSAGIYAAWRVVDWLPPMAGSARFVSSIPIKALNQSASNTILDFFNKYNTYDGRTLKGVFVTFQTFEVYENRYDQEIYQKHGKLNNPAQAYTVGSLCPWYEEDMKASITGRQLVSLGQESINLGHHGPMIYLIPVISNLKVLDASTAIFSMDFGNTWPEQIHPPFDKNNPPAKRGDASFTTYPLGRLSVRYGLDPATEFYSIQVDDDTNPREKVFEKGCVFDLKISDPVLIKNIQDNLIRVYLTTATDPTPAPMLEESPYMIVTDQKGCYGEEGDKATDGFRVFNQTKEDCVLRIFERGIPVTSARPCIVYLARWEVFEAANDPIKNAKVFGPYQMVDKQCVNNLIGKVNLDINDNSINFFVYSNQYPWIARSGIQIPPFNSDERGYTIMDTGSFVCLRVHQNKDVEYAKYYDHSNWDTTPPDFDVVYEEVFKLYDIVYPVMAEIHPFVKEQWENGTMAGKVLQRTNPNIWENILYMPKSRELSRSQRKLLEAWAAYVNQINDEDSNIIS